MRYQFVPLLALIFYLTEAGPVHRLSVRTHDSLSPRFLNASISSAATLEAAPSTSSIEEIPISSDVALAELPPSRITTSADHPTSEQKNGVDILPEGVSTEKEKKVQVHASSRVHEEPTPGTQTMDGTAAGRTQSATTGPEEASLSNLGASSSYQPSSTASDNVQHPGGTGASPRLPDPSNNLLDDSHSGPPLSSNSETISSESSYHSGSSLDTTSSYSSTVQASSHNAKGDGAAMEAFVRARSTETLQTASSSSDLSPLSATTIAPSTRISLAPVASSALSATIGSGQASQTIENVGAFSDAPSVSVTSKFPSSPSLSSIVASHTAQVLDQVPSEILEDTAEAASQTVQSSSQSSLTAIRNILPSTSAVPSQLAQQYNDGFRNLHMLSQCDPSDAEHVSACVHGQLAKCEIDGTYSVLPCDQGESCYAVPKSNGGGGVEIGCYSASDAKKLISPGSASDAMGPVAASSPQATSSDVLPTQAPAFDKDTPSTPSQGGSLSITRTSQVPESLQPSPAAHVLATGHDRNTDNRKVLESETGREEPQDSRDTVVSNAQASTVSISVVQPPLQTIQQAKHDVEGLEGNLDNPRKGVAAAQNANIKGENQDDSGQQNAQVGEDTSGVQLSFPGSTGSNGAERGNNEQTSGHGGNHKAVKDNAKPETNEKIALAADQSASPRSSSTQMDLMTDLSESAIPTGVNPLGSSGDPVPADVTAAPAMSNAPMQGFVTVTVTRTTTVRDRD